MSPTFTSSDPQAFTPGPNPAAELPGPTPKIISCSIRVIQPHHEPIFQVIPRLVIERSQVVAREDASSIRITSLILALRTALEFQAFRIEEPLLASLIAGTVQCPSQVSVSTTRIPDFKGDGYKGESSGYQFLGHLSEVNLDVVENCTQHTKVYSFGEVISAALTPRSAEFFSNNRPLDIIPESHFILIFTFRKGSLHPQGSGGSDIYHTFSSTHASDLELPLSDFSDLEIPSSDFSAYPFHNSDTDFTSRLSEWAHSQSACPVSNPDTGGDLGGPVLHAPSRAVSVTSPRTGPYPSRSRSGSVSTEQKIILLLSQSTHLPPTTPDTILRDAKFVRRNSTLSAMIRNHRAMGILLKLCGLDSSQTLTFEDPSAQTRSLTYESVMKACGWSDKTFSNKESHYRNSEKAAGMAWTGDAAANHAAYNAWQGVVYLWSPIGPILSGVDPSPSSSDASENLAAALTQRSLEIVAGATFRTSFLTALSAP